MNVDLSKKAIFAQMVRLGDLFVPATPLEGLEAPGQEPTTPASKFKNREGYDPAFLEGWTIKLPMATGGRAGDMLGLRRGGDGVELKYQHFSVIMSASRRMPMITACNIDGSRSQKVPRISTWSFDGRLDPEDQWGDELYFQNDLDRGHMVRREDPVWGSSATAIRANADTFHFTNSCPQMAGVNQKTWVGLENYILHNARVEGLRVNVYTGPVFKEQDLTYRNARIPGSFWKVVAIITEEGRPSATAYKVMQTKELEDLEFVYGAYKTFQVSIRSLMKETGIDFSVLEPYDGFSQYETTQKTTLVEKLERLSDIRI